MTEPEVAVSRLRIGENQGMNIPLDALQRDTICDVTVMRAHNGTVEHVLDHVAEEVPIALTYHSIPYVVMLASPSDLEDLAIGFTLSEQLVEHVKEIHDVTVRVQEDGTQQVEIGIDAARFSQLLRHRRNISGRSGCGLCGVENLADAIRSVHNVPTGVPLSVNEMQACLSDLRQWQRLNEQVGSVHAAAWIRPGSGIQTVREDVGRHNALDKLIGAMLRKGQRFDQGYFLVTSRASFELVQKAIVVGACGLIAVSAPTALAIRLAEQHNLTLVGFARGHGHVVYAHAGRLIASE